MSAGSSAEQDLILLEALLGESIVSISAPTNTSPVATRFRFIEDDDDDSNDHNKKDARDIDVELETDENTKIVGHNIILNKEDQYQEQEQEQSDDDDDDDERVGEAVRDLELLEALLGDGSCKQSGNTFKFDSLDSDSDSEMDCEDNGEDDMVPQTNSVVEMEVNNEQTTQEYHYAVVENDALTISDKDGLLKFTVTRDMMSKWEADMKLHMDDTTND